MNKYILQIIEAIANEKQTSTPQLKIVNSNKIVINKCSDTTLLMLVKKVKTIRTLESANLFISMVDGGLEIYAV